MILRNEFAAVALTVSAEGNRQRLRIEDLESGRVALFDALELQCLIWADAPLLDELMRPSARRWNDADVPGGAE